MIIKKKKLVLRKLGDTSMMAELAEDCVNMTNVYSMNSTAAMLWEECDSEDFDVQEFAVKLTDIYEVDFPTAIADVRSQLQQWNQMGLITLSDN